MALSRIVRQELVWLLTLGTLAALTITLARAVLTPVVVSSSLVVEMPARELARQAEIVILARVDSQSERLAAGYKLPSVETTTRLRTLEVLKGPTMTDVALTTQGGRVGNVLHVAEDQPTFDVGGQVIVFLVAKPSGGYSVLGAFQGRYRVDGDVARNEMHTIPVGELRAIIRQAG